MAHNRTKHSDIKRKSPLKVKSHEYSRKPTLYSAYGDLDKRIAVQSHLARQMLDFRKPKENSREFSSYFHAPMTNSDAAYVVTSHTAPLSLSDRRVPTYKSLVENLRYFTTEISPNEYINKANDVKELLKHTYDCYECERQGPLKVTHRYKQYDFKDNIMRFSDINTMTPMLSDACCGVYSSIAPTSGRSEATTSSSDVAVRDQTRKISSQRHINSPAPILKKPESESNFGQTFNPDNSRHVTVMQDFPTCGRQLTDYEVLMHSFPAEIQLNPPCPNNSVEYSPNDSQRKTIYNEGIDDINAINVHTSDNLPYCMLYPRTKRCPKILDRPLSRISIKSKCMPCDSRIPHTHRGRSKYHYDCKKPRIEPWWEIEGDLNGTVANRVEPRQSNSKRLRCERAIKLPKRVLTSERNIESFIDNRGSNMPRPIYSVVEIK